MIARSLEIDEQHDQWSLSLHLTQVLPKGISPARQIYLNGLDHMSQIRASITTMTTWRRVPICKAKQACSLIAGSSCAVVCFNNVIFLQSPCIDSTLSKIHLTVCLARASRFQVSVVPQSNFKTILGPRRWVRGRAPWRSGRMSWQHAIQFSTDICFCPNWQKLMRKVQTCCRPDFSQHLDAWDVFSSVLIFP